MALWLAGINLLTFVGFWVDKRQAVRAGRRISEKSLLTWAYVGGALGGRIAQRRFRHKTRKQPFATHLVIALWSNLAVIAVLIFVMRGGRA